MEVVGEDGEELAGPAARNGGSCGLIARKVAIVR
jgi:hypothetical protein